MFALFNLSSKWTFNVQDLLTLGECWNKFIMIQSQQLSFLSHFQVCSRLWTWNNLTSFQKFKPELNFSCTFLRLKQDLDKRSQIKDQL